MKSYLKTLSGKATTSTSTESALRDKEEAKGLRIFTPETDAEQCIRSLKYDNLSTEEFDSCWQACSEYRLNEIMNNMSCIKEILNKWPEYKKPTGYRLIDRDFSLLCDGNSSILNNWDESFRKILAFLNEGTNIKDRCIKGILDSIKCTDTETDSNSSAFKLLWCLHGYLVPTQKIVKKDNTGKKTTTKFTIKDSQEAFAYVGQRLQQLEDHIHFLRTRSENIQLFILAFGDKTFNNFV